MGPIYEIILSIDVAAQFELCYRIPQAQIKTISVSVVACKARSMYKGGIIIRSGEFVLVDDSWDHTLKGQYCRIVYFFMAKVCLPANWHQKPSAMILFALQVNGVWTNFFVGAYGTSTKLKDS